MDKLVAEPEELRAVEYERLNQILLVLWERVQTGELGAIDRALSVMDRISKLYGLDSPKRTETNMQISQGVMIVDGTKDEYMDAIRKQIDYPE